MSEKKFYAGVVDIFDKLIPVAVGDILFGGCEVEYGGIFGDFIDL